jgi:site-specific DNA-methyltransferase (adenine-specific)
MAQASPLTVPQLSSVVLSEFVELHKADCLEWLPKQPDNSFHAVVTDPPYGMLEFTPAQLEKLRAGRGGVWRIPPSLDGYARAPVPRFTVLAKRDLALLYYFFLEWGTALLPKLVPGAHVFIASSPLLSYLVSEAMVGAGYEKRGEVVRLTQTLRGGDRPKNAESEFPDVTVMPRSAWEPWLILRKPFKGTVAQNLRAWQTGALRRSTSGPFMDAIRGSPTRVEERSLAKHPSLKPQAFLRQIVRASLPLGQGKVLDPFAGSGSTLAACQALRYQGVGIEIDDTYFDMACDAIPALARLSSPAGSSQGSVRSKSHRAREASPLSARLITDRLLDGNGLAIP